MDDLKEKVAEAQLSVTEYLDIDFNETPPDRALCDELHRHLTSLDALCRLQHEALNLIAHDLESERLCGVCKKLLADAVALWPDEGTK